jgi:N-acetyltransferase
VTDEFREPVTLLGRYVELAPLSRSQIPGLTVAGRDPEIWRLLRIGPGRNETEMTALVEEMLRDQEAGTVFPFAVLRLPERTPSGMFRFLDIDRENRSVELGTWLSPTAWRTPVNTEVKYLGLRHAFETERFHRVQLRTDSRNVRSQRAIERLGAIREGVHREHFRLRDGTYRTSVVYSILAPEWPRVRADLVAKLARPWSPPRPAAAGRLARPPPD